MIVDRIDWQEELKLGKVVEVKLIKRLLWLPAWYGGAILICILIAIIPPFSNLLTNDSALAVSRSGAGIIVIGTILTIRHLIFYGRVRQDAVRLAKPELSLFGPTGKHVQKNPNRVALEDDVILEGNRNLLEKGLLKISQEFLEKVLFWEAMAICLGTFIWGFADLLVIT